MTKHVARVYDATLTDLPPNKRYVIVRTPQWAIDRNAEIDARQASDDAPKSPRKVVHPVDRKYECSTRFGVVSLEPRSKHKRKRLADMRSKVEQVRKMAEALAAEEDS